ncbi:MAG: YdiU family protein [Leptospira sp.]|nr:YdiU family protein [Leptospira sp.]
MTETSTFDWKLDSTYSSLPASFYKPIKPSSVSEPSLVIWNERLANDLGISSYFKDPTSIIQFFSGNWIPEQITPIAQAYAGHQFGNFTMLGDGRAILLGEHVNSKGDRFDIQLKGSGRTPFSRGGDGRATLSSMLREYLISEAMFALNIPTTRSLAVLNTGEIVRRADENPGGILTRVAKSHVRVGTFEYTYHFLDLPELEQLTLYTIRRHFPHIEGSTNPYLDLLEAVMEGQIDLILHWLRVGFIHGVMNTDNTSIACETIDYGPCAFMNSYDPNTVFSSIDVNGRYSYGNQPAIIHWNLSCFANTLLPLIDKDQNVAIDKAKSTLDRFPEIFHTKYWEMLGNKIGFLSVDPSDKPLIQDLLNWMKENAADYTNTFLQIELESESAPSLYNDPQFLKWKENWKTLIQKKGYKEEDVKTRMRSTNPFVIPRNFKVESALQTACVGDMTEFHSLLKKLNDPYLRESQIPFYDEADPNVEESYQTFCGT